MRRRRAERSEEASHDTGIGKTLIRNVKKVDFFPKFDPEAVRSEKTSLGAIISITTGLIIFWLLLSEIRGYLTVTTKEHVGVDILGGEHLTVHLNISFSHLRCEMVHLTAQDVMGNTEILDTSAVKKIKLSATGYPMLGTGQGLRRDTGCRLSGKFKVKRVKGNFHVALGRTQKTPDGRLVHHFRFAEVQNFKAQHTIHYLRFGEPYEGLINPLDNHNATDGIDKAYRFQYFIKIVPTRYINSRGTVLDTAQFAATRQTARAKIQRTQMTIPGVFFIYDISSYMVTTSQDTQSFATFLTSICAIIGGTYTIAGVISSILHHSVRHLVPHYAEEFKTKGLRLKARLG